MISRRTWAIIGIVVLMIVWGTTFVVTKAAMREIPPLTLAVLRYLVAALVLVPLALGRGGFRALPRPLPVGPLLGMGLTGIAIFTIGFNYALIYGSASQGALIYALVPAAVAVAAVAGLGETPSRRRILGIGLSVVGTALVVAAGESDRGSPSPLLGAAWMFLAVAAWAWYTVIAKRLAQADPIVVIACVSVAGTAILLPFSAIELLNSPWSGPSLMAWAGVLFLGAVASAAAFVVYNWALRELDASLVGAFVTLDPIVGVLTAVIFLGESLQSRQLLGGVVALIGMWLAASTPESSPTLPEEP